MNFLKKLFTKKRSEEDLLDRIEILKRQIAQGIGETASLRGIAEGLGKEEMKAAVQKEKQEIRETYLKEKLDQ